MAQAWSIIVNASRGVPTQLNPDVFGIPPGQPLKAQIGDLVSWNNQSGYSCSIQMDSWSANHIPPFTSSPGYVILDEDIDKAGATGEVVGTIQYVASANGFATGWITVLKS
ncbi:MAG TPA: hypothetical protein VE974_11475 [Thermoanaerobaculia bacterium]|nr:hypothetical protein [Thermoanaerobaculia bacterium]